MKKTFFYTLLWDLLYLLIALVLGTFLMTFLPLQQQLVGILYLSLYFILMLLLYSFVKYRIWKNIFSFKKEFKPFLFFNTIFVGIVMIASYLLFLLITLLFERAQQVQILAVIYSLLGIYLYPLLHFMQIGVLKNKKPQFVLPWKKIGIIIGLEALGLLALYLIYQSLIPSIGVTSTARAFTLINYMILVLYNNYNRIQFHKG